MKVSALFIIYDTQMSLKLIFIKDFESNLISMKENFKGIFRGIGLINIKFGSKTHKLPGLQQI